MDKKSQKRLQILKDRLRSAQQRLIGAKRQPDDLNELEQVQREVAAIQAEVRQLTDE